MEKKNDVLKILFSALCILLLGFTTFIAYNKESNKTQSNDNSSENKALEDNIDNSNQVIKEVAFTSNNSQNNELDFSTLINQLKDAFQTIYSVKNGSHTYCGSGALKSDKLDESGTAYYISKSYATYDELLNGLKKYATTEEIIGITKDNYIEENGKLYCKSFKKVYLNQPVDYVIQIDKISNNKIYATIAIELNNSNIGVHLYENYKVEYEKTEESGQWVITNYSSK